MAHETVCRPHQMARLPRFVPHWLTRSPSRLVRVVASRDRLVVGPGVGRVFEAVGIEQVLVVIEGKGLEVLRHRVHVLAVELPRREELDRVLGRIERAGGVDHRLQVQEQVVLEVPVGLDIPEIDVVDVARGIGQLQLLPVLVVGQELEVDLDLAGVRLVEGGDAVLEVAVDDRAVRPHQGADLGRILGGGYARLAAGARHWRARSGPQRGTAGECGGGGRGLDQATAIERRDRTWTWLSVMLLQ